MVQTRRDEKTLGPLLLGFHGGQHLFRSLWIFADFRTSESVNNGQVVSSSHHGNTDFLTNKAAGALLRGVGSWGAAVVAVVVRHRRLASAAATDAGTFRGKR